MSNRVCLIVKDCRIGFRNFSGKQGLYNQEGNRNFCLFIDDREIVDKMILDGWNFRFLKPRDEQEEPVPYLPINVKYSSKSKPPIAVLVSNTGQKQLSEETIGILDWVDIEKVDVKICPYHYEVNGKKGVKAYLSKIYVVKREDELDLLYADTPITGSEGFISDQEDEIPF